VQRKILIVMISIVCFSLQSFAQGNLMILPIRVVFEGNKQKEELLLSNTGKDTAVYILSFVQKKMTEDGGFINLVKTDSSQMSAEPYLRLFPRRVKLAPRESQVISLQFRRKPDMADGEYRSHLYFRPDVSNTPLGMEKNTNDDPNTLSFNITPIFGISIAIIIRIGTVNVSASLSDLKLENQENGIQNLKLTINRTGNISLYGDIIIKYFPSQGKPYQVGIVGGLGVYSNIDRRFVTVKLNNSGKPLNDGKLKVQYISKEESKKPVVYAEGELDIR
jgi:hypothetical protein